MMPPLLLLSLVFVAGLLAFAEPAIADPGIIYVDTGNSGTEDGSTAHPYNTIQEGIDAASSPGDIVQVADGAYTGEGNRNLDFGGKAITVRSENGPKTCILFGEYRYYGAFWFHNGEGPSSVVDGFSLECWGETAVYCDASSPTVTNCIIRNNLSDWGAGMWNRDSSPTLTNCIFEGNLAEQDCGGGMRNDNSSPMITDCIFKDNGARVAGGGMYNDNSSPTVTNCVFEGNVAGASLQETGHHGNGGMCNYNSSPAITNCIFDNNRAGTEFSFGGHDGGMSNLSGAPSIMTNCTFESNSTTIGSGVIYDYDSLLTMIIWITFLLTN